MAVKRPIVLSDDGKEHIELPIGDSLPEDAVQIDERPDSILVNTPGEGISAINYTLDTSTATLSGKGTIANPLKVDVAIDSSPSNGLTIQSGGLYANASAPVSTDPSNMTYATSQGGALLTKLISSNSDSIKLTGYGNEAAPLSAALALPGNIVYNGLRVVASSELGNGTQPGAYVPPPWHYQFVATVPQVGGTATVVVVDEPSVMLTLVLNGNGSSYILDMSNILKTQAQLTYPWVVRNVRICIRTNGSTGTVSIGGPAVNRTIILPDGTGFPYNGATYTLESGVLGAVLDFMYDPIRDACYLTEHVGNQLPRAGSSGGSGGLTN